MGEKHETPYASAMIDFLDRDSGKSRRSMCYPITRILLLTMDDSVRTQVAYEAGADGRWHEIPPPELKPS